jgi:hypothetical protein
VDHARRRMLLDRRRQIDIRPFYWDLVELRRIAGLA